MWKAIHSSAHKAGQSTRPHPSQRAAGVRRNISGPVAVHGHNEFQWHAPMPVPHRNRHSLRVLWHDSRLSRTRSWPLRGRRAAQPRLAPGLRRSLGAPRGGLPPGSPRSGTHHSALAKREGSCPSHHHQHPGDRLGLPPMADLPSVRSVAPEGLLRSVLEAAPEPGLRGFDGSLGAFQGDDIRRQVFPG